MERRGTNEDTTAPVDRQGTAARSMGQTNGRGSYSIAVVGGGVAGLSAARELERRGHRVLVIDKGRRPAGRISTRRTDRFAFDHGAQYFTAREPRFRAEVEDWCEQRFVAPWQGRVVTLAPDGSSAPVDDGVVRYVGVPGMSALAGYLASDLEVESDARVTALRRTAHGWRLAGEGGDFGAFDRVLLALPPAQAAPLLGAAPELARAASAVRLRPCWAVLIGLDERYTVDFDGAFVEGSALSWIARNSSKPGRDPREAWVLHAGPAWSTAYAPADAPLVLERLTAELERATGVPLPKPAYGTACFWRYALPDPALEVGALADPELGIAVAGDWCQGGRVEGAFLSGLAAADALVAEPVHS